MNTTRVLLADSETRVCYALRLLLQIAPGIQAEVVGEVNERDCLLPSLDTTQPDLLLIDWGLLRTEEGEGLAEIHKRAPHTRVIVLSGRPEVRQEVIDAGAEAFVSKADPPDRLVTAIRSVLARQD